MTIAKFTGVTNTIQSLSDRPNQNEGLTPAQLKQKFDQFAIDNKAYLNDIFTVEVDTLNSQNVKLTGNQSIAGVKIFTSSPIVPIPTTEYQATPKKYIDDMDIVRKLYIDDNFTTKSEITNNRKLSATGDFTGTVNGLPLTAVDPFISSIIAGQTLQLADIVTLKGLKKDDINFDNATIINSAINLLSITGGGKILLPVGTFTCKTPIQIKSNIVIEGYGQSTILKSTASNIFITGDLSITQEKIIDCVLRNFYIYGNGLNIAMNFMYFTDLCIVENVRIENVVQGIKLLDCWCSKYVSVVCTNITSVAFYAERDSNNICFYSCKVYNANTGFTIYATRSVTIDVCNLEHCQKAIVVDGAYNTTICNCYIEDNVNDIQVGGIGTGYETVISNNYFFGTNISNIAIKILKAFGGEESNNSYQGIYSQNIVVSNTTDVFGFNVHETIYDSQTNLIGSGLKYDVGSRSYATFDLISTLGSQAYDVLQRKICLGQTSTYAYSAPTLGGWSRGDRVINLATNANGYEGWVCITNGIPGVWKGYGTIQS